MRKLEDISKEYKDCKDAISFDVMNVPIAGRVGFIMRANQAKENISKLKREYEDALLSKSIVFFLDGEGSQQNKFAGLAAKLGKAVVVDADVMYKGFATFLAPSIGHHNEFTVNQLTKLEVLMQEVCLRLNLERAVYPEIENGKNAVNTHDELVQLIKDLVIAKNGYNLTVPFIKDLISNKALDTGFNSKVLLVVVPNANPEDRLNLRRQFTKSIEVDLTNFEEEKAEDFVNKTLRDSFKTK